MAALDAQEQEDGDHTGPANGQVDVENPAPVAGLGKGTTHERAHRREEADDHEEHAQELATVPHGHQVTHDEIDHHVDAPSTDTLHGPACDEHGRGAGSAAETATEGENGENGEKDPATTPEVRELAKERLEDSSVPEENRELVFFTDCKGRPEPPGGS